MDSNNEKRNRECQLILRIKSNDVDSFTILYSLYSAKLYNFTLSILYDKTLAEDITQNCFLKLWERRNELDSNKNLSSYIFAIARNLVYKETQRLILENKYKEHEKLNNDIISNETIEDIDSAFVKAYVDQLVEDLPAARKQIFEMRRNLKLSNREIAEKLDISEKTVETQFYRALSYIKERLKSYYNLLL